MTISHAIEKNPQLTLQDHFHLLYQLISESKLIPDAAFENLGGFYRCLSGISFPSLNMVMGFPPNNEEECIEEQLAYFHKAQMPFFWYVTQEESEEFKKKLIDKGFQDVGIFQGVIGKLTMPIPQSPLPPDCILELVEGENALEEFNTLVCETFGMLGNAKEQFKILLKDAMHSTSPKMFHWVARHKGKVVSALSTLVKDDIASYWNAASLPEMRKQGFNTALLRHALQHAVERNCRIGISYLLSEGLALGICNKLGLYTQWRLNVFLPPSMNQ